MIDETSPDGAGWARFSDDRKHRYLIGRRVSTRMLTTVLRIPEDIVTPLIKVVFVMLNPSDANASKPDPTWGKCCQFGQRWGADIVEAVNLDSLISPYPEDLWRLPIGQRGDDEVNNDQIRRACGTHLDDETRSRIKVVCAWGNNGERDGRGALVTAMLYNHRVRLHRLDRPLTQLGQPVHPLARGKNHVPLDTKYVPWGGQLF